MTIFEYFFEEIHKKQHNATQNQPKVVRVRVYVRHARTHARTVTHARLRAAKLNFWYGERQRGD